MPRKGGEGDAILRTYIVGGRTLARRKGPTRTSLGYQASKQ